MKKVFVLCVVIMCCICSLSKVKAKNNKESLHEFLKTTDKISANFEYPNYQRSYDSQEKFKIPAHTPFIIKAISNINSNNIASGDEIYFETTQVMKTKSGGILVKRKTPVMATVNFQKAKRVGKSGHLTISDFHLVAVDGTYIPLSSSISVEPSDEMVESIVLSVLICPLFLFMKGPDAIILAGTTKTVYTTEDVYVEPLYE